MKPLTHGSVLIAGAKASNFGDDIKNHPRIIMWDSQDGSTRWAHKPVPENTQAILTTKWIGHAEFDNLMKEARRRRILMFPRLGTGQIAKMVIELLTVPKVEEEMEAIVNSQKGKLTPLVRFIDPEKTQKDNAIFLLAKAEELKIETNIASVTNLVYRKTKDTKKPEVTLKPPSNLDVVVGIFDNAIKELQDAREYIILVTEENRLLKARIEKFKKSLDED